jgi:hypothetical protein
MHGDRLPVGTVCPLVMWKILPACHHPDGNALGPLGRGRTPRVKGSEFFHAEGEFRGTIRPASPRECSQRVMSTAADSPS